MSTCGYTYICNLWYACDWNAVTTGNCNRDVLEPHGLWLRKSFLVVAIYTALDRCVFLHNGVPDSFRISRWYKNTPFYAISMSYILSSSLGAWIISLSVEAHQSSETKSSHPLFPPPISLTPSISLYPPPLGLSFTFSLLLSPLSLPLSISSSSFHSTE